MLLVVAEVENSWIAAVVVIARFAPKFEIRKMQLQSQLKRRLLKMIQTRIRQLGL